jgi:hypothetical protein
MLSSRTLRLPAAMQTKNTDQSAPRLEGPVASEATRLPYVDGIEHKYTCQVLRQHSSSHSSWSEWWWQAHAGSIGISAPHRVPSALQSTFAFPSAPPSPASSLDRQAGFHKQQSSAAFNEKLPSIFPEDAFVRRTFARAV